MTQFKQQLQARQADLVALRRDFHRHPELALQEFRTAQVIEAHLDRWNIPHHRVGPTGVLGVIRGGGPGRGVVVLRADIDALPIQEVEGRAYRSQTEGIMHACGHDAHTTCLLGAAQVLAEHRDQFGGEVRLMFQAAEEVGNGALPFLESGALDGAQRVFGLHTASDLLTGQVGLKPGLNNASVDHFQIKVRGKSAHVSTPERGADALYIASHIVVALQALVTRRISPVEPVIVGIGRMEAGTTYNALAETALLEGTTRTISLETQFMIRRQVDETAQALARLYGGEAQVEWEDFASPLINDPQVCQEAAALVEESWGAGHVVTDRPLSLSGDDFAEYLLRVPGAYAYLGTGNPDLPGTQCPAHNGGFDIDEDALPLGAALYADYAFWWLTQGSAAEDRETAEQAASASH